MKHAVDSMELWHLNNVRGPNLYHSMVRMEIQRGSRAPILPRIVSYEEPRQTGGIGMAEFFGAFPTHETLEYPNAR